MKENNHKVVYISHAYGGKKENADKVAKIIIELHKLYPDYIFISPIHNFGMLYEHTSYTEGLTMCLWLLNLCNEMWVMGHELSTGVRGEISYCKNHYIPYKILGNFDEIPLRKVCHKNKCDIDCLSCDFENEDDEGISCWLKEKKLKGEIIFK